MLKETLDLIHSLKKADCLSPTYTRIVSDANYEDFADPRYTHLVATVEYLTDVLDYATEEVEDMDDEANDPAATNTGRWTATSTYDVYMVDTPDNNCDHIPKQNGDECGEKQSKRRRQRK
ncbi:hypothetical protein D1007_40048 [Hordeum vulgare]|nr:hypothetical protein D1007_40048 [Hordeum vulgare]